MPDATMTAEDGRADPAQAPTAAVRGATTAGSPLSALAPGGPAPGASARAGSLPGPAATPRRWRMQRTVVTGYFVLYGVLLAVWVTRIRAIKQQLRLSDGLLGIALPGIPAGALVITLLAGRLVDRFGSARVTLTGGIAMPLLLTPPALAPAAGWLAGSLIAFGLAAGALNVGMNAGGVELERAHRRRVMTSLHAGYSLGALAGAVAGGLAAQQP
jgi:MFS family permease